MFERVPRPLNNPGKGGLWRLLPWALDNQKPSKKRKIESTNDTCVNTPLAASPSLTETSPGNGIAEAPKNTNLMDTLATLALSSEAGPMQMQMPMQSWGFPTENVFHGDWSQPPSINYLNTPFFLNSKTEEDEHRQYGVILDPVVGEKTLLQATFSDSHCSSSII
jgi:hypothetical protein